MLELCKQRGGKLAGFGDGVERGEGQIGTAAAQDAAERLCGQAAGGIPAAGENLLVCDDLFGDAALFSPRQRAGAGEEIRKAGENALREHVSEIRLILRAQLPAESLNAPVYLEADGKFLVIIPAYKALALVHDVAVFALRQHRDARRFFKAGKTKNLSSPQR